MAKLVRIFDVNLYVGFSANAKKCYDFIKYLNDKGIKYNLLNYSAEFEHHKATIDALNSWYWTADKVKGSFTDFPILAWTEGFDDFTTNLEFCTDVKQVATRNVITQSELI